MLGVEPLPRLLLNFTLLDPNPVFLKTWKEPVLRKFQTNAQTCSREMILSSVEFFFKFNISGMAYFQTVFLNFF